MLGQIDPYELQFQMMAEEQGPANRQFYSLPSNSSQNSAESRYRNDDVLANFGPQVDESEQTKFLQYISVNVLGANKTFSGPFGLRKVVYLDYVASGRALDFIEDYIRLEVLPEYGNTHTTTSVTSLQTTLFRHEARDILRNSFNASEHDSVIFTGSGSTGAVHKLIHALHLKENPSVILVGPYEHHSNILPWKEAGAEVIRINQTEMGHVDMNHLEMTLKACEGDSRQVIGAFSAASNVTGILTDVDAVTICLHKHKALAVWDYACAAPYVKLDMNPYIGGSDQQYVYKDAVILSVHKFVGGISTPGVLMAKKKLFKHPVPEGCGGGSVFFVRRENHRYLQEPESKEEGGTPAIVQSIRAGLVVQLRDAVGLDCIRSRDQWLLSQAQAAWKDCLELIQLGPPPGPQSPDKLPIFAFLILHRQTGRFLHHNFVAAVLNDVFGIQARGGCACAGPYAMDLLGLDEKTAKIIEDLIAEDSRLDRTHLRRTREYSHREILRPGFVRLNLPYFMDNECLQFVLEAVRMTAECAWMLLPQYLFNPETAEWRQRHFQTFKDRKWLGHISYQSGKMEYHEPKQNIKGPLPDSYQDCLMKATNIFEDAKRLRLKIPDQSALFDEEASKCRWFVLPSEASACLLQDQRLSSSIPPQRISQDKLPFFPGRSVHYETKPCRASEQPDVLNDVNSEKSKHANDHLKRSVEKTLEGNKITISPVNHDDCNESDCAVSDSAVETAAETEPSQGSGILALEEALKYADAVLKECSPNETTAAVNNAMANIWHKFEAKGPEYLNIRNSKSSKSHVEEVTSAMNQIWNLFPSEGGQPVVEGSQSIEIDSSAITSKTQIVKRELNESEGPSAVESSSLSSAAVVVTNGLHQIWEGFNLEKGQGSAELLQPGANDESAQPKKANKFNTDTSFVNETHKSISINKEKGLMGETNCAINCAPLTLERDQENKGDCYTLNPKGDASNVTDKNIGVMSHRATLPRGKPSESAFLQIQNVMNEIWNGFTPSRPRLVNTDIKKDKITINSEADDRVSEIMNKVQGYDVDAVSPTNENIDGNQEILFPKPIMENDNISNVKRAMSEIRKLFTPDNQKPNQTSDNSSKNNKLARLEQATREAWEKCYGTDSTEPKAIHECNRTKDFQMIDKVAEVTNAMSEIWKGFEPASKTLSIGDSKLLSNSSIGVDTKNEKVSEVMNAMNELWAHFTPTGAKDKADGVKAMSVSTDSKNGELEVNKTMPSAACFEICNKVSNCSIGNEKDQLKKIKLHEFPTPDSDAPKNFSESHQGSSTAATDCVVCPLIKHKKQLLNESAQKSALKQNSVGVQWFSPPKQIFKPAVTALEEYAMLKNGDKVLVCLSGGKDSLSLLHTIRQYQFYARGKGILFEFGAVTVDPMTPAYDPSALKQYLASLEVPYFYESQCILETAEQLPYECASICSFCSRMKRGRIYAAARREGYNVLALGQHLDDLTESFLMSFFHNGNLNTMKAHYTVKQGDLRVIRPFVYVREADLRAFAEQCKLPIIAENCPACFEAPKERHRTKQLLAAQEVMFPQVYSSMMTALKPLMARGINEKLPVSEDRGEED